MGAWASGRRLAQTSSERTIEGNNRTKFIRQTNISRRPPNLPLTKSGLTDRRPHTHIVVARATQLRSFHEDNSHVVCLSKVCCNHGSFVDSQDGKLGSEVNIMKVNVDVVQERIDSSWLEEISLNTAPVWIMVFQPLLRHDLLPATTTLTFVKMATSSCLVHAFLFSFRMIVVPCTFLLFDPLTKSSLCFVPRFVETPCRTPMVSGRVRVTCSRRSSGNMDPFTSPNT